MGFLDFIGAAARIDAAATAGADTPFRDEDDHLETVTFQHLYPTVDPSTVFVGRQSAMKIASAARGRNLIAQSVAVMPLVGMRGGETKAPETNSLLLTNPEKGRPLAVTMAWTVDQMLWHGRAWWYITERYPDGRAKHVRLVFEDALSYDPLTAAVTMNGETYKFSDFILFESMNEGVLTYGRDVLLNASLVELAAARASRNPVPSIELHQKDGEPLDKSAVQSLLGQWIQARNGANGGVAYSPAGLEVITHGQAAEQLLIDGRNAAALDVARAMNLPAWAVDGTTGGSSLTYTNVPSRARELRDYTLRPFMEAITQRLSLDDVLAHGQWCRFDDSRFLRDDFKGRMEAGKIAIEAGIYSVEEIRAMEDDTPLEVI